nr:MAG TPA: hypothetical protein [Caudoviricetes sp.]
MRSFTRRNFKRRGGALNGSVSLYFSLCEMTKNLLRG